MIESTRSIKKGVKLINTRLPSVVLTGLCVFMASCGGGGDGGGNIASCSDIISIAGEPDMTGAPYFSASTVTAGDLVTISVPIDADVAHISLSMISDLQATNISIVSVVSEAVTPGEQVWQYQIDTTNYDASVYYPDIDLCTDSNSCTGASAGIGVAYSVSIMDYYNYYRRQFWNNGLVNDTETAACMRVPFVRVN